MEYTRSVWIKIGCVVGLVLILICIVVVWYGVRKDKLRKSLWYEYNDKIMGKVKDNGLVNWPSYDKVLDINGKKIKVAIADTYEKRGRGFMDVKEVPSDSGILFIFDVESKHCFWMKNTYVKLSIAFINKNREIVEIKDMKPLNENSVCPAVEVLYALEMPYGYFRQNNIKEKDTISFVN